MKWGGFAVANLLIVLFLIALFIPLIGLRNEVAAYGGYEYESTYAWALIPSDLLSIPALISGICLIYLTIINWKEKNTLTKTVQSINALAPFPALAVLLGVSNNNIDSLLQMTFFLCLTALSLVMTIVTNSIFLWIWAVK
jgi:hypothetical protein